MVGGEKLKWHQQAKDVVLVHTVQNPSEEDDYDNCYYEFIARNDGFWRAPEIDFCYETKARKVLVDFKFDSLYR